MDPSWIIFVSLVLQSYNIWLFICKRYDYISYIAIIKCVAIFFFIEEGAHEGKSAGPVKVIMQAWMTGQPWEKHRWTSRASKRQTETEQREKETVKYTQTERDRDREKEIRKDTYLEGETGRYRHMRAHTRTRTHTHTHTHTRTHSETIWQIRRGRGSDGEPGQTYWARQTDRRRQRYHRGHSAGRGQPSPQCDVFNTPGANVSESHSPL